MGNLLIGSCFDRGATKSREVTFRGGARSVLSYPKADVFELDSSSRPDGHGRTLAVPQNLPTVHLPFFGTFAPAFLASDKWNSACLFGILDGGPFFEPLCSLPHSPITFAILPTPFSPVKTFLSLLCAQGAHSNWPLEAVCGKSAGPREASLERPTLERNAGNIDALQGRKATVVLWRTWRWVCARSFERPLSFHDPVGRAPP